MQQSIEESPNSIRISNLLSKEKLPKKLTFSQQNWMQYEREKEILDKLISEFVEIVKRFDKRESLANAAELNLEKSKFETDFVAMNCDIQQIRSENESLMDDIRTREESIKIVDHELQETANLISILEEKVRELKREANE